MDENKEELSNRMLDQFPRSVIFTRWFFVAAELGIALYFAFNFKINFGLFFLIYAMICGTVILPILRCTKCYYFGKRCNFGWGVWVSRVYPKSDDEVYSSSYGLSFLFWPLRIIPVGIAFKQIAIAFKISLISFSEGLSEVFSSFVSGLDVFDLTLLAAYFVIIFLHRKYYRARACSRCYQREACPVYDFEVIPKQSFN